MDKLSVTIITLNEEKNIGRCLKSVREVADEVVVVDSFSSDSTEKICSEYNVRFIRQKWLGYSEQKNFANSQAANDWILSIDADEELGEELIKSIKKEKEKGLTGCYSINRLTNYCGHWIRHCGWYPDRKIRIWNKNEGQWKGLIHETIDFQNEPTVKQLCGDMNHYTYHTISEHIRQADKFTTLTAQEAYEKNKKASNAVVIRIKTLWKFFSDYIIRLGFLDGYYGYVVCKISAFATFLKYTKLHELNKNGH